MAARSLSFWHCGKFELEPSLTELLRTRGAASSPGSSSPQSEQWELLTTLCTGLLGALGFFWIHGRKGRWTGAKWLALASAACAVLSLVFGYMVYLALLDMLRGQMFDLAMPAMWVRYAQFYCFLLAVMLFGDFAFQNLYVEDENEPKQSAND